MQTNFPEGWTLTTLGQITRVRRGASPRPIDSPEWFADEGPGWVRITDVTRSNGRLRSTEQYLSPRGVLRSVPVKPGQLIMSICATIGEPAIVEIDACIHDGFVVFDQYEKNLDTRFLYYFLRYWMQHFRAIGQTGTQANLNTSIVNATPIIIPPFPEQRRIAKVLDTIDETIAHTSSLIAKLKQIKAGLLHDLLTRGLDENGELRDAIAHPEQFKDSPLGQIPKEWEVHTMQELTTKIVDGVHKTPVYVETGVPFLTVENLTAGVGISLKNVRNITLNDHAEYSKRADPKLGDVLVSKDGTLGVARIITDDLPEVSIFVSVAQLRPNEKLVLPSFICTFFETGEYKRQLGHRSAGTGLKHIHLEHFRAFQLATPSIEEQRLISKFLDTHDTRIRTEETYLNKLKLQKKGLMHDLLTGKVRVNQIKNNLAISTTA